MSSRSRSWWQKKMLQNGSPQLAARRLRLQVILAEYGYLSVVPNVDLLLRSCGQSSKEAHGNAPSNCPLYLYSRLRPSGKG